MSKIWIAVAAVLVLVGASTLVSKGVGAKEAKTPSTPTTVSGQPLENKAEAVPPAVVVTTIIPSPTNIVAEAPADGDDAMMLMAGGDVVPAAPSPTGFVAAKFVSDPYAGPDINIQDPVPQPQLVARNARTAEVEELIKKLTAAQEPLRRSITKSETYTKWVNDYSKSPNLLMRQHSGEMDMHHVTEMRYDGQRYAVRERRWGKDFDDKDIFPKDNPLYASWLWDGARFYGNSCWSLDRSSKGQVNIEIGTPSPEKVIIVATWEVILRGYYGGTASLESALSSARSVQLRDGLEQVGGSDCQVLEADTQYGEYVLWIDPAHGYNVARAEMSKRKGDLYGQKDMPWSGIATDHEVIENVRFAEVDGVWVPMECNIRKESKSSNGTSKSVTHHKRTEVKLNPDFEALGSFLPDDIKEGALAFVLPANRPPHSGIDQYRCTWHDGKPVPYMPDTERGKAAK